MKPDLKIIKGGGDIIVALKRLLTQAEAGELDAIVYATCTRDPTTGGTQGRAYREDMDYPLARTITAGDELLQYLRSRS